MKTVKLLGFDCLVIDDLPFDCALVSIRQIMILKAGKITVIDWPVIEDESIRGEGLTSGG